MAKTGLSEREEYRQNLIMNESKKSLPLLLLITILAIGGLMIYITGSTVTTSHRYGIGNPYNCKQCKDLGFACEKHRNFDLKGLMTDKITNYTYKFVPGKTEAEQKQLMYGADYNTKCDFCNELKAECYSDKYDRERINAKLEEITKDDVFRTKLNNEDWKLGYANSSNGRAMLLSEIKAEFNGSN